MKFTLALFLGVISAKDLQVQQLRDRVNALKIKISQEGQAAIQKEANDVAFVAHAIENSRPVRNLRGSLERWAKTKEVADLKKLDEAFLKSPEGQRLMQEWQDVGRVLEEMEVFSNQKDAIHIDNAHLHALEDELTDVAAQYESLRGSKWETASKELWERALTNKQAGAVERRAKAFKKSKQGQALGKEVKELGGALKKHVKVSDIPESWKKDMNMLKIEVSREGQYAIEDEYHDIEHVAEQIKDTPVVKNLGYSLKNWSKTKEVQFLKELDKKFLASPEGQRLMQEWNDFGQALHESIVQTERGIHIRNSQIPDISDELDDVADQYEKLEGSKWDKAYHAGWEAATTNEDANKVREQFELFKHSREAEMLGRELQDLDDTIKEYVKVTDIPEEWKQDMNLLKVTVHNQEAIESEWTDVENTWNAVKDSRAVRNLGSSLKRWGNSKEVKALKKLDKKFIASPEGQELIQEWRDVGRTLDGAVYHNDKGFHIDNAKLQELEDELDDVADQYEQLEGSKWDKAYTKAWEKAVSNRQAKGLKRRAKSFKKSAEGKALGKELEEFGKSLHDNVKVTDVPEHWKKDMYLF